MHRNHIISYKDLFCFKNNESLDNNDSMMEIFLRSSCCYAMCFVNVCCCGKLQHCSFPLRVWMETLKLLEESRKLCRKKDVFVRMILSRFKSALKMYESNSLRFRLYAGIDTMLSRITRF